MNSAKATQVLVDARLEEVTQVLVDTQLEEVTQVLVDCLSLQHVTQVLVDTPFEEAMHVLVETALVDTRLNESLHGGQSGVLLDGHTTTLLKPKLQTLN
jgi:hypothetical protein